MPSTRSTTLGACLRRGRTVANLKGRPRRGQARSLFALLRDCSNSGLGCRYTLRRADAFWASARWPMPGRRTAAPSGAGGSDAPVHLAFAHDLVARERGGVVAEVAPAALLPAAGALVEVDGV